MVTSITLVLLLCPQGLIEDGSQAQWFVDCYAAFEAIALAIGEAKSEVRSFNILFPGCCYKLLNTSGNYEMFNADSHKWLMAVPITIYAALISCSCIL